MEAPLELRTPVQGQKAAERPDLDSGCGSSIHRSPQDSPEADEVAVRKFSLSGAECDSAWAFEDLADASGYSLLPTDEEPEEPAEQPAFPAQRRRQAASPQQSSAATNSGPPAPASPPAERSYASGNSSNIWKIIASVAVPVAVVEFVIILVWLLTGPSSPKVRPCPEDWICFGQNCYYFSTDTKSLDASKEYCASHGATLPVIKEELQLENIKRLRQNHYYWIGLRKEAAGWQWDDGSLFTNNTIQLENEDAKLNCSFLNTDKIVTVDCTSSRRWICVKESN
uniref:C-type lectin domain-containing protein n=1 Tax=Chelydra serpentina TaxID=8475 RepID=A0A8C3RRM4_CHESE